MKRRLSACLAALVLLAGCVAGGPAAVPLAVETNADAEVFVEPDDGPEPVLSVLDAATRSLDVVVYLLTEPAVIGSIEAADRRGARVRVLLEQRPFGGGPGNIESYGRLKRSGVDVRWANPRFRFTHQKAVVADNHTALIMTLNLTASAFRRNREYGVINRTPEDVAEVAAMFEADWHRATYVPVRPGLVISPDNARAKLMTVITSARRTLDVEAEVLQDDGMLDALIAAAKRGVQVRLVISPAESGPDSNRRGADRLRAGGVQIRFMRRPFVHAKMMVADGQAAFVGSENMSTQSLDGNRELGVLLSSAAALSRLQATFEQDWNNRS